MNGLHEAQRLFETKDYGKLNDFCSNLMREDGHAVAREIHTLWKIIALIYLYEVRHEFLFLASAIETCSQSQTLEDNILAQFLFLYISLNLQGLAGDLTASTGPEGQALMIIQNFRQVDPQFFVNQIEKISAHIDDKTSEYYGKIAKAFLKIYHENDPEAGLSMLREIIEDPATSDKIEPYLLLFQLDKSFGSLEH